MQNRMVLEYELIMNKKLYEKGVITDKQYQEVDKMIRKKIQSRKESV